jgi:hypothetical protein
MPLGDLIRLAAVHLWVWMRHCVELRTGRRVRFGCRPTAGLALPSGLQMAMGSATDRRIHSPLRYKGFVVAGVRIGCRKGAATHHAQSWSPTLSCRSNRAAGTRLGCGLGVRVASCVACRRASNYLLKLLKAS